MSTTAPITMLNLIIEMVTTIKFFKDTKKMRNEKKKQEKSKDFSHSCHF